MLRSGDCHRVLRDTFILGSSPPDDLEHALCLVVATKGVASHWLAATLYGFDSAKLRAPLATVPPEKRSSHEGVRRQLLSPGEVTAANGILRTTPLRTLLDMASLVDARTWEQMLEYALRKRLVAIADLDTALATRRRGNNVIRTVLAQRPEGAPPTESLLETLMVQLIRDDPRLPEPERQVKVFNRHDREVARVDLAWPDLGVFIELDGQHHQDQPVHDARRETAVVAAKGWLPGRFSWHEVTRAPRSTANRLAEIIEMSARLTTEHL